MNANVIDIINDRLIDLAGHGKLLSTMSSREGRGLGCEVLDALHTAGYVVLRVPVAGSVTMLLPDTEEADQ